MGKKDKKKSKKKEKKKSKRLEDSPKRRSSSRDRRRGRSRSPEFDRERSAKRRRRDSRSPSSSRSLSPARHESRRRRSVSRSRSPLSFSPSHQPSPTRSRRGRSRSRSRSRSRPRSRSLSRSRSPRLSRPDTQEGSTGRNEPSQETAEEKARRKAEEAKAKALRKMYETPAEKRARRLAKKEAKRKALLERQKQKEQEATLFGYTNDDNPFGDANLTEKFVWKAKHKKLRKEGIDPEQYEKERAKQYQEELADEIKRVKERREQRAREKLEWEQEQRRMALEKELGGDADFEEKEATFHLEQARLRSQIRVKEGRPKPVDLLYHNLQLGVILDDDEAARPRIGDTDEAVARAKVAQRQRFAQAVVQGHFEEDEPAELVERLPLGELEQLAADIPLYKELDQSAVGGGNREADDNVGPLSSEQRQSYWAALETVCANAIEERRRQGSGGGAASDQPSSETADPSSKDQGGGEGVHRLVSEELFDILNDKSASELVTMRAEIMHRLRSDPGVNAEYWAALLDRLRVHLARAQLRELHADLLRARLTLLESAMDDAVAAEEGAEADADGAAKEERANEWDQDDGDGGPVDSDEEGGFSPELLQEDELDADAEILDAEADQKALEEQRQAVQEREASRLLAGDQGEGDGSPASAAASGDGLEAALFNREKTREFEEGEEALGDENEYQLQPHKYVWMDKFRPRKPRYYNRVHTGYDWNSYNKQHYDFDNPPPKQVQGYKFNIFYPDLMDPTKTPSYKVLPGPTPDTQILLFRAGAPYEDIAFKIVAGQWMTGRRSGFRCQFDRGILSLWFRFVRNRYRK